MSLPEVLLWQALRENPAGLKFRRQHPTGPYALDFYCIDARIAIELDGEAHERGDRPARDAERDRWLREKGIETLRIPAVEVLRDLESVLRGVVAEAKTRLPLHHPALRDGPPPRDKLGEDLKEPSLRSSPSLLGEGDQPQAGGGATPPPDQLGED